MNGPDDGESDDRPAVGASEGHEGQAEMMGMSAKALTNLEQRVLTALEATGQGEGRLHDDAVSLVNSVDLQNASENPTVGARRRLYSVPTPACGLDLPMHGRDTGRQRDALLRFQRERRRKR